jgi:hypothetical protein
LSNPSAEDAEDEVEIKKDTIKKLEPGKQEMKRTDTEDDGLRMIISRSDQYGLTGLQKRARDAPGTIALGSGRRLSTKDFIKEMQQLDPKSKIKQVESSNAPEEVKQEVRRVAKAEKEAARINGTDEERTGRPRARTNPGSETATSRPDGPKRALSDLDEAGDYFSPHRPAQPAQPERMSSANRTETVQEEDEEEEDSDIPTHNIRSSIAKHGRGVTAADQRRQQLTTIRSNEDETPGEEGETAAEKRRRLAALGIGERDDTESESDEEDDQPRRTEAAVQEPGEDEPSQPKARIQWGGESGRERQAQAQKQEVEDMYAGDPIVKGARKLKSMFKKS